MLGLPSSKVRFLRTLRSFLNRYVESMLEVQLSLPTTRVNNLMVVQLIQRQLTGPVHVYVGGGEREQTQTPTRQRHFATLCAALILWSILCANLILGTF